jgi:hypothetical protein
MPNQNEKKHPMKYLKTLILILFLSLYIAPAHATMNFCNQSKWIGFPGVGYSYFNATSMVGLELSGTVTDGCAWFGAYADHYTDFGQKNKSSVGLELGFAFLGLDFGYMHYQNDQESYNGVRVRPIISIGFISIYSGGFFTSNLEGFFDGGLLLKLPFCHEKYSGFNLFNCI